MSLDFFSVAGIGSRETPKQGRRALEAIGAWCAAHGVWGRSGHAKGADAAFEVGCAGQCVSYVPWTRYNQDLQTGAKRVPYRRCPRTEGLLFSVHPKAHTLSDTDISFHGRNVWIVLGPDLASPVDAVVCWTPGGRKVGGTATGIALAEKYGIPVFNFGTDILTEHVIEQLEELLKEKRS